MSWILRIIPFPILLLLVGLAFGAAALTHVHYEIDKRKAREAGVPQAIAASELGKMRAFPWYEEVTVQVQTHQDLTYVYWEEFTEGVVEYPIVFFFDPSKTGSVREVLGAFAFDSFEEDDMVAYLDSVQREDGALGPVYELTGAPQFQPYVTYDEVKVAAAELGVSMSPNFLYINPYFTGRDTRIQARPELTYIAGGASVLFIWLSMIAAIFKKRRRRAVEHASTGAQVAKKGLVAMAAGGVKMMVSGEEEGGIV